MEMEFASSLLLNRGPHNPRTRSQADLLVEPTFVRSQYGDPDYGMKRPILFEPSTNHSARSGPVTIHPRYGFGDGTG